MKALPPRSWLLLNREVSIYRFQKTQIPIFDQEGWPEPAEVFDFLLDQIPDLIFFNDHKSRFIRVNRAMLRLFVLPRVNDVIGKTDFLLPEDASRILEDEQEIMRTGRPIVEHKSPVGGFRRSEVRGL